MFIHIETIPVPSAWLRQDVPTEDPLEPTFAHTYEGAPIFVSGAVLWQNFHTEKLFGHTFVRSQVNYSFEEEKWKFAVGHLCRRLCNVDVGKPI